MPIMPGIFEMVLIGESPESMSPWHRRFAELFEALYETGYTMDYQRGQTRPSPFVARALGRADHRGPSHGLALRPLGSGSGPVRCLRRRPVPMPDGDAGGRQGLRQTAEQLHRDGPVGPDGNRARLARASLQQRRAGDQARGRIARPGHLDHERRIEQGAGLVLLLRLLLPRHADGQRVQRPRGDGAGPFPAASSTTPSVPSAASA